MIWRLGWQKPLVAWIFFLAWLSYVVRLSLTTGVHLTNFLDDTGFVLAGTSIFAVTEWVGRRPRVALQALLAITLTVASLVSTLHFRFFGTFANVESLRLIGQLQAAAESVFSLLTCPVVFCGILAPLLLAAVALHAASRFEARRLTYPPWIALLLALGIIATRSVVAPSTDAADHHNPVLLFARQLLRGASSVDTRVDRTTLAEIREDIGETIVFPPASKYLAGANPGYPLQKIPTASSPVRDHPPNVVIILMESVRSYETGSETGGPSFTPSLRALSENALSVSNFYAVGDQTVRGEVAILCSMFDHFGGAPIYVRFPDIRIKCLPEILRDQGYTTHWISSFSSSYFNKNQFLSTHGIDQFHDMQEVSGPLREPRIGWGPPDENLMEYAIGILSRLDQPFFAEIMTLSNHHPFDYRYSVEPPIEAIDQSESKLYRDFLRGVFYTDHSVGLFFQKAKFQPWFKHTIFVITSDHGIHLHPRELNTQLQRAQELELFYRVPLLIIGPGVRPGRLDLVSSQVDVAPTLLDVLGVTAPNSFMGISLLEPIPDEQRISAMSSANEWHFRQGNRYCYAIGQNCVDGGFPACPPSVAQAGSTHACFETESDLLRLGDPSTGPSMRLLSENQAKLLITRGDRLVRYTRFLLKNNAISPPDEPEAQPYR